MATAHDVAAYILAKHGPMSAMKLQKLVYYSQAWHLVWAEQRLFDQRIEAWANGPVVRDLFAVHSGQFSVSAWPTGNPDNLETFERGSVDAVIDTYGKLDGRKLSHLTHAEAPWRDARGNLGPTDRSNAEITAEAMAEYYGAVDTAEDATPVDEMTWDGWETPAPTAS